MKINKKLIALSIASTLVLPMVGCESSASLFSFEFGKDKTQVEEFNKFGKQTTHTDEEAVNAIISGEYTIEYNNQEFTVPIADVLNTLFPNCEILTKAKDENTWLVKFESNGNYIIYRLSFLTGTLVEQELHYDGATFKEANDNEAHRATLGLIVKEIIENGGVATSDEGKSTVKEDKKVEKKKTTDFDDRELQKNLCTCKYCGKKYDPKESNSWENETYCSKQCQIDYEEQQATKEEEQYKYHCAYCGAGYRPDSSDAEDKYSFCSRGCEGQWYYEQQQVVDDYNNGIDHSICKGCGREIGLNGGEGYCHDCNEARYNGWE